jgi:hypothetical protein
MDNVQGTSSHWVTCDQSNTLQDKRISITVKLSDLLSNRKATTQLTCIGWYGGGTENVA